MAQTIAVTFIFGLRIAIAHHADHGGAASHVVFHFLHAIGRLDGNAAGVEGNAFADQLSTGFLARLLAHI